MPTLPHRIAIVWASLACLLCAISSPKAGYAHPKPALDDTELIQEWNAAFLETVRLQASSACLSSRNLTILQIAMFDAVNAIRPAYQPFCYDERAPAPFDARIVAIGAAHWAATNLYPTQRARFDRLKERQLRHLPSPDASALAFGQLVAQRVIDARADDGSSRSITYVPRRATGQWSRTPPRFRPPETPHWPQVRPFSISDAQSFQAPGPPPLDSPEYAAALREVQELGGKNSPGRSAEQTEIARFWTCFLYTATPAGHWNEIACSLIAQEDLAFLDSLRLLALINVSMADAGIVAWQAKYGHHHWRPAHAVQRADRDGNPLTSADPAWKALLETPPHPEYVSGHSVFSGAGAETLRRFFGTDQLRFDVVSDSLPGVTRSYHSLSACEKEISLSRIYGGIHFRYSTEDGGELGRRVASAVCAQSFQPLPNDRERPTAR